MSDAMTYIYRDQKREEATERLLVHLIEHLKQKTDRSKKDLFKFAEDCDSIRGGYFTGGSNFVKYINRIIEGLEKGDRQTWIAFLDTLPMNNIRKELYSLSPFGDNVLLVNAKYGNGFAMDQKEFQNHIDEELKKRGHGVYKYQKYTIIMEKPKIKEIIVASRQVLAE